MNLSQKTINELKWKLEIAEEESLECEFWIPVVKSLRAVIDAPTTETLAINKLAMSELDNAVDCGYDKGWAYVKPMVADLARAGYYQGCSQPSYGRKIKERVIDGVKIPVGY